MKKQKIVYEDLLDIEKIKAVYHNICVKSKHREKIVRFELFLTCNFVTIYKVLENRKYAHGIYNIFLLIENKYRIIMSENMSDKIINHLISKYVLFPVLEPKLIETNIATRKNKGTKAGIFYMKKYINSLKINHSSFYILKCDIYKYFYSIDHEILKQKLSVYIQDKGIWELLNTIIDSTDSDYVNKKIKEEINAEINHLMNLNICDRDKKIKELGRIPLYEKGKGLPIGNMSSQIMAIFYLNNLDHFIKEKLQIKYYIRYMDDFILLHPDREYLKYCLKEIEKELAKLKLFLNDKTEIREIHQGVNFLGYRFWLKNDRLLVLVNSKTKRRIRKKIKGIKSKNGSNLQNVLASYKGYLSQADCREFRRTIGLDD